MQVSGSRGWQGRGTPAIQLLTAEIQLPTAENKQNRNHCWRLLEIDARQRREDALPRGNDYPTLVLAWSLTTVAIRQAEEHHRKSHDACKRAVHAACKRAVPAVDLESSVEDLKPCPPLVPSRWLRATT